jgi:hypothetical protein
MHDSCNGAPGGRCSSPANHVAGMGVGAGVGDAIGLQRG